GHADVAGFQVSDMQNVGPDGTRGLYFENVAFICAQFAGVADLAAHFGIKVGLVEDQGDLFAGTGVGRIGGLVEIGAVPDGAERGAGRAAFELVRVVGGMDVHAGKFVEHVGRQVVDRIARGFVGALGDLFGLFHELFVAGEIDGHAAFFGHDSGEVYGEAV